MGLGLGITIVQEIKQEYKLVLKLALESGFFDSCLPITESLFKSRQFTKGLLLLEDRTEIKWRSKQDYLLGLVCPLHRKDIVDYYKGNGTILIRKSSEEDIEKIDNILAAVLMELGKSYTMLQQEGFLKNRNTLDNPGLFMKRLTMSAINHGVTSLIPHRLRAGPESFRVTQRAA
tara:strand:- start:647 stop:1171 length:525 start_codon:yes stop_codon:yes gene_type:complete